MAVVDDFEKVRTFPLSLEQGTNKLLILCLNDITRLFRELIARSLNNLTKKNVTFNFYNEYNDSFDKLKDFLCSSEVLIPPDCNKLSKKIDHKITTTLNK